MTNVVPYLTCTKCGKRTYPTRAAARKARRRTAPGDSALHVYLSCRGDGYHLGHMRTWASRGDYRDAG